MRTRIWAVSAATCLAGGALLVAALGPATAASSARPHGWAGAVGTAPAAAQRAANARSISLVAHQIFNQDVDVKPAGFSAGDYFVFAETLSSGGKVVGRDEVRCMVMYTTFRCEGALILNGKGQVDVAGSLSRYGSTLAVTGGTNNFVGARGQLVVGRSSGDDTPLTLELLP